jgi:hypothetical protein
LRRERKYYNISYYSLRSQNKILRFQNVLNFNLSRRYKMYRFYWDINFPKRLKKRKLYEFYIKKKINKNILKDMKQKK